MNAEKAELVALRIAGAKKTFREVEEYLVENQLWNTAVNRLYYACFYSVLMNWRMETHGRVKRILLKFSKLL